MTKSLHLVAMLSLLGASALASDWPRFAGPAGNATATDTGLLKAWPASGPKELWSVDVGKGFGGVAVKDGEVYILDRVPEQSDILRCFDLNTGTESWRLSYDAPGKISYSGSRSHPAVDETHVFIYSPFGELRCVDRKTHAVVWIRKTMKDYSAKKPNWAYTQSPLLYKNTVIVAPIGESTSAVAYDKSSGDVVWESPKVAGGASYASPMLATIEATDQVLLLTTTTTAGLDAGSGKILWSTDAYACKIPVASPTHIKDGLVFVTGGYKAGCAMFKIRKTGDTFSATTVFQNKNSNGQIHQPVLVDNHLYLNGNDKGKRHGLICLDLHGELKWSTGKSPGFDWGGMLLADGRIYVVDGTTGDLCMVKPTPKGYTELARSKVLAGDLIWSTIAMVDGKILLRDQKRLKCVDVKTP
jgi:outer membrane protein assembly factor BamB